MDTTFEWQPASLSAEALAEAFADWLRSGGLKARAEAVPGRAIDLPVEELARRVSKDG